MSKYCYEWAPKDQFLSHFGLIGSVDSVVHGWIYNQYNPFDKKLVPALTRVKPEFATAVKVTYLSSERQ
jgi:hypothetical protein